MTVPVMFELGERRTFWSCQSCTRLNETIGDAPEVCACCGRGHEPPRAGTMTVVAVDKETGVVTLGEKKP